MEAPCPSWPKVGSFHICCFAERHWATRRSASCVALARASSTRGLASSVSISTPAPLFRFGLLFGLLLAPALFLRFGEAGGEAPFFFFFFFFDPFLPSLGLCGLLDSSAGLPPFLTLFFSCPRFQPRCSCAFSDSSGNRSRAHVATAAAAETTIRHDANACLADMRTPNSVRRVARCRGEAGGVPPPRAPAARVLLLNTSSKQWAREAGGVAAAQCNIGARRVDE